MSSTEIFSACSTIIEGPDLWSRRLPPHLADRAPTMSETEDVLAWQFEGRTAPPSSDLMAAVRALPAGHPGTTLDKVRWLASAEGRHWIQRRDDTQGEVLYSTGGVWTLINACEDAELVAACYRAYNDWVADLSAQNPDSIVGLARIPVTGLDDAVSELTRAVKTLRLKGAILDAWPDGFDGPPSGPGADTFWKAAADLGAPISIHQGMNGKAARPPSVHHGAAPSYGFDLNAPVYGNVFDRYPNLKIVVAGPFIGWAPSTFEGLGESYMRMSGIRSIQLKGDLLPNDYLRTFYWYVFQDDRFGLSNRNYFGDAHLMWGSFALNEDDSVWPNTRRLFETRLADLTEDERRRLGSEVVCRLYGLRGAKPFTGEECTRFAKLTLL